MICVSFCFAWYGMAMDRAQYLRLWWRFDMNKQPSIATDQNCTRNASANDLLAWYLVPFSLHFFQCEDCDTFWAWIMKNNHNERLETITEMFFTLLTRQKSFYTCHVEGVPRSHRGDLIDTFGKRDQAPRVANLQRWRIRSSDHPRWENNRKTSYLRVHSAARCSASRWFLLSTCDVKNRRIHKKYQKTKPTVQCSATVASRGSSGFGALQLTF